MTDPTAPVVPVPTPAQKAVGGLSILKYILAEVATLQRPVTAAAVACFVLTLIPGVGLTVQEATAIVAGIGAADAALAKIVK